MKRYLLAVLICVLPLAAWGQPPGVKPDQMITLVFSSNVYGEIEPCG
jgi:hypothetical protein